MTKALKPPIPARGSFIRLRSSNWSPQAVAYAAMMQQARTEAGIVTQVDEVEMARIESFLVDLLK